MENEDYMGRLQDDLALKDYSASTRSMYTTTVKKLLDFVQKPPEAITEDDVRRYILHMKNDLHLSNRTINSYIAALRFFFSVTMDRPLNPMKVPKMKTTISVPEVFTEPELKRLMNATTDVKYQAIFSLAYGSGLRVSEIRRLHVEDIRSDSMQIFVRESKRRKERYTILGEATLNLLRRYYVEYHIRKTSVNGLLFPGDSWDGTMSSNGINNALKKYLAEAGIVKSKDVSMHTLRHSFATLLLESGADIFLIKRLMGHSSLTSTEIYMHVAIVPNKRPVSPADL